MPVKCRNIGLNAVADVELPEQIFSHVEADPQLVKIGYIHNGCSCAYKFPYGGIYGTYLAILYRCKTGFVYV